MQRPLQVKVLPSLLAADMGNLEAAARKAEACGADALHIDIMDGHLVPNLSMGPAVVQMARRCLNIPLSVHLMLTRPDLYVRKFVEAGANSIQIHIEAECDPLQTLCEIRKLGCACGITLNPETPPETIHGVIGEADEILCMTVHPGYGGQKFIAAVLPKIRAVRTRLNEIGRPADVMVDGGIDADTVAECARHGANVFVAGTSLFSAPDMAAAIKTIRQNAERALAE